MRNPIYVRPLRDAERKKLQDGLRSSDAFVMRRCQIVMKSAQKEHSPQIAQSIGYSDEGVRQVFHAFNRHGLAVLKRGSSRPHHIAVAFRPKQAERLRGLLHLSPRTFGKPSSLWTLDLAAEVSFEQGLTATRMSGETVRLTLARLGVRWARAKRWITSPGPDYTRKKKRVIG